METYLRRQRVLTALGSVLACAGTYLLMKSVLRIERPDKKPSDVEKQANEYFPVQSPSEIVAGHPIVGSV